MKLVIVIVMMSTNEYVEIRNGGYYVAGTPVIRGHPLASPEFP